MLLICAFFVLVTIKVSVFVSLYSKKNNGTKFIAGVNIKWLIYSSYVHKNV